MGSSCVECPANCTTCKTASNCTTCDSGLIPSNGSCGEVDGGRIGGGQGARRHVLALPQPLRRKGVPASISTCALHFNRSKKCLISRILIEHTVALAQPGSTCGPTSKIHCGLSACCSQYGFCGQASVHCGTGCQPLWGYCGAGVWMFDSMLGCQLYTGKMLC